MYEVKVKKHGKKIVVTLRDGRKIEFRRTKKNKDGTWRYDSRDSAIGGPWNKSGSTKGGYLKSDLHKAAEAFIHLLPDSLVDAIVPVERISIDPDGEERRATVNIFVPDASEIFPDDKDNDFFAHPYKQLKYYKNPRNRIRVDEDRNLRFWWTASAHSGYSTGAVYVYGNGYSSYSAASSSVYAPVCFHINPAKLSMMSEAN